MRVAGLILVTGAAAQSQVKKTWPDCLTKGYILKNNETNSIFADIRPLGASKGCWQDNCGSTDKTEVLSLDHCAATCAKIPECNFWSVYDNICYFRTISIYNLNSIYFCFKFRRTNFVKQIQ